MQLAMLKGRLESGDELAAKQTPIDKTGWPVVTASPLQGCGLCFLSAESTRRNSRLCGAGSAMGRIETISCAVDAEGHLRLCRNVGGGLSSAVATWGVDTFGLEANVGNIAVIYGSSPASC
jgi:hypothetical protein